MPSSDERLRMRLKHLDEDSLIAEIIRNFGRDNARLEGGIGDDAAVILNGQERFLYAKDLLIEDVHFLKKNHPPDLLGRKSLSVNISDIAAMGGRPEHALLGLGIPPDLAITWVESFFSGFRSCAEEYKTRLIGGDITRSQNIVISVTVLGRANRVIRRSGASCGDLIYVSGSLGDAAFGLELLQSGERPEEHPKKSRLFRAFLDPKPRIELGLFLARNNLATAMMDLSDGVSKDLPRLCRMSGTGADIWEEKLPVSPVLKESSSHPFTYAVHGGEDYELIFTVPPSQEGSILEIKDKYHLSCIGCMTGSAEIILVKADGSRTALKHQGFDHFTSIR
jgi:thiamine-monophosphate kinase